MLIVLRVYVYLACGWGLLCLPPLGLRPAIPAILAIVDALPLAALALTQVLARTRGSIYLDRRGRIVVALLSVLACANVWIATTNGGSAVAAIQYLAALARPLGLLALLVILLAARRDGPSRQRKVYKTLVMDLAIITGVHFIIAALQWAGSPLGEWFIPALSEAQSGLAALAEGHVSGGFPNSIDFSYYALAVYVVLTLESVYSHRRAPSLWVSALFATFIYKSGSATSVGCFVVYWAAASTAPWSERARRRFYTGMVCAGALGLAATNSLWSGPAQDKIEDMMLSRLGLLLVATPQLIVQRPGVLMSGMGSDFLVIEQAIKSVPDVPLVFTYDDVANVINDVFWVGTILSLGVPFALLYVISLYNLLKRLCSGPLFATTSMSVPRAMGAVIAIAGFFNQILLVRSFYSVLCVGVFAFASTDRMARSPAGTALGSRISDSIGGGARHLGAPMSPHVRARCCAR